MALHARFSVRTLALIGGAALAVMGVSGCDAGGLVLVENKPPDRPPEVVKGQNATDLVSGGNVARNGKYKLVHTMGQPTPQSVTQSPDNRMNGGLSGATNPQ